MAEPVTRLRSAMSTMFSQGICLILLVFLNTKVTGLLFTASPRRLELHSTNSSQWLSLSCSPNHIQDLKDVYIIEIGRIFHRKYVPIVQVTAISRNRSVILDKPNEHRITTQGGIDSLEPELSSLHVTLTDLRCEDVTSHYCLVYYVTSSRDGIKEARSLRNVQGLSSQHDQSCTTSCRTTNVLECVQQNLISAKSEIHYSGVILETSPSHVSFGDHNKTTAALRCSFLMSDVNVYRLEIGRKTRTSSTTLVLKNRTGILVMDEVLAPRMKVDGRMSDDHETWLSVTLSPAACSDVGRYYCSAVYSVGNITAKSKDEADLKGSCTGTLTTPSSSIKASSSSSTTTTATTTPSSTTTTTTTTTGDTASDSSSTGVYEIRDWSRTSRSEAGLQLVVVTLVTTGFYARWT